MTAKKDVVIAQGSAPSTIISQALTSGADLEKLQGLLDLQERWEANEAKKAYVVAMSAFKADPPTIIKDKTNKQYGSTYSSLENFVAAVISSLGGNDLSHSWDIDQSNGIKVSCKITHAAGHSETTSMTAPADTSGKKNPIQQIKSTVTYLKLATLEAITGLASEDGSLDDDGAGGQGQEDEPIPITMAEFNEKQLEIDSCTNKTRLDKWIASNKPWIDRLSEDQLKRIRAHCQQYYDMFKEKEN